MNKRLVTYNEISIVLADLRFAIKEARRRDSITYRELGKDIGVPFNSISRFEKGGDIWFSHALSLISWLALPRFEENNELSD